MGLSGLLLVGRFAGTEQVHYGAQHATRAGQPVEGFHRIKVERELPSGHTVHDSCSYREQDRETGYLTPLASQLAELKLADGEAIAVKVKVVRIREVGERRYVDFDALSVSRLADVEDDEPVALTAAG